MDRRGRKYDHDPGRGDLRVTGPRVKARVCIHRRSAHGESLKG
jgi:hypothetical protein